MQEDAATLYAWARSQGLRPALLESAGVVTPFGRLTLLGVGATRRLEVWEGITYLDGEAVGDALEVFRYLEQGLGARQIPFGTGQTRYAGRQIPFGTGQARYAGGYFPAWIGFFAYEYARHLGLPTHSPMPGLPEAAFYYYPEGYAWLEGQRVQSPSTALAPVLAEPRPLPQVELHGDYPERAFLAGVAEVQERIRAGWVYQVNLSHRFRFAAHGVDPLALYRALRRHNPSPFMGLLEGGPAEKGYAVVSGSPERLFDYRDGVITARPIAGTRPRGRTPEQDEALGAELRASAKERAEHVMLVDLLRNDLARVCEPGSVEVSEAFTLERYSHVMHLVSEVRGRSRAPLREAFASIFPGGTITGAPKESVMRAIAELEPVPRGAYTGSMGYVSGRGCDFNILIRSFSFAGGTGYFSAGAGIVIESDPEREYAETQAKAEALLQALGQGREGQAPALPRRDSVWRPPIPARRLGGRVIFLENHDSFSYNLVDYLRALGAEVRVVDHGEAPDLSWATHLVVGPGPGEPATAGRTLEWTRAALEARLPFLGICLGHQALGVVLGARLERSSRPVHGEAFWLEHRGEGIFAGVPSPARFTRYHSLLLCDLPPVLRLEAWTASGLCMALSHRRRPAWGVQFHPESLLSEYGMVLLGNFLSLNPEP
ncbi:MULTISPECIES: chorismate-binding protein [unclassified Meiothermus]|uniref:chorismate-binding protein n=1 Tax=unclassified Meiothermus TaxID=370471 RepID=UPI000D7CD5DF|nr:MULTISPECIES: chorismate-binding protein [unclassified Meiothermus]PZA07037.1 aminodeoxychorismate components I/II [Meiothermus sp. Pnk-1]RYM34284.1 aminodeoxychorismate components I/II [Meiothermus sp. PNK-Is4]